MAEAGAAALTQESEEGSHLPPEGLKVISRAMEIPLVNDAVDQTVSLHNSMLERGGLFGKAYSLWFSTTCKSLSVASSALQKTETTSAATKKVWAKWVTIDDVLAEKLGIELPEDSKKLPKEILIEVGGSEADEGEKADGDQEKDLESAEPEPEPPAQPQSSDASEQSGAKARNLNSKIDDSGIDFRDDDVMSSTRFSTCGAVDSDDDASVISTRSYQSSRSTRFKLRNPFEEKPKKSAKEHAANDFSGLSLRTGNGSVRFTFASPELKEKIILTTYLGLNKVNVTEDDPLEAEFGLVDDLISFYSHLRLD